MEEFYGDSGEEESERLLPFPLEWLFLTLILFVAWPFLLWSDLNDMSQSSERSEREGWFLTFAVLCVLLVPVLVTNAPFSKELGTLWWHGVLISVAMYGVYTLLYLRMFVKK